jgi:SnoaL-like domain
LNSEDERAIIAVLLRYASAIDRRDWTLFASCFTEDVEADYGSITRRQGRDLFVDYMTRGHANIGPTLHRMSNFVIAGDAREATATSYVDALLMRPDSSDIFRHAHGWYEDRLVRGSEGWKIARRRFVPVWIQESEQSTTTAHREK